MLRFFKDADFDRSILLALPVAAVIGLVMVVAVEWFFAGLGWAFVFVRSGYVDLWLLPIIGGVVIALLMYVFRQQKFEGLGQIQEYMRHDRDFHERYGSLNKRDGFLSFIAHFVALICGGFSGVLGPLAYIVASGSRQVFRHLPGSKSLPLIVERHVMAASVAAALSVALNAPLAAVFFACEVILRQPKLNRLLPIMMATLTASIGQRLFYSDVHPLSNLHFSVGHAAEYGYFALMGLSAGILAVILSRSVGAFKKVTARLSYFRPIFGGVILGMILFMFAESLPSQIDVHALEGLLEQVHIGNHFGFALLLFIAVIVSVGCDIGTGIFAPSLLIGALFGANIGMFLAGFSGWHESMGIALSEVNVYALVGMAAFCAAVMGAPFFAIMLAFELSLSYAMTSAVMLACIIAAEVMYGFCAKSYFHYLRGSR